MPVIVVVARFAFVIAGLFGPLILVHVPVPEVGTFPAIVVLVILHRL
jgi:hypothetical protein